jgi:hypothetical protein
VSSEDRDGGYVHEPGAVEARESDATADATTGDRVGETGGDGGDPAPTAGGSVDYRGWALVAAVVVAFLVVPGLILVGPPALPYEAALLALPVVPAALLGAVAVWAAVANRRE